MSFTHETSPFQTFTWSFTTADDGTTDYKFYLEDAPINDTTAYPFTPTMRNLSITRTSGTGSYQKILSFGKEGGGHATRPNDWYITIRMNSKSTIGTFEVSYSLGIDKLIQTGTDNDLSDLKNHPNAVTVTEDAGITYYDIPSSRMKIVGTLFHDPEREVLIFHDDSDDSQLPGDTCLTMNEDLTYANYPWQTASSVVKNSDGSVTISKTSHGLNVGDAIRTQLFDGSNLDGQKLRVEEVIDADSFKITRGEYYDGTSSNPSNRFRRVPSYNYGEVIEVNGRTRYSAGTGLIFSGASTSVWDPDEFSMDFGGSSHFWARGGTIITNRPFQFGCGWDGVNLLLACNRHNNSGTNTPVEVRTMGTPFLEGVRLVNMSAVDFSKAKKVIMKLEGAALTETLGSWWELSLKDFDVSENANGVDIGHDGSNSYHHHDYEILNSANGSNIIAMWRPIQRNAINQKGVVSTKKEVSFVIKDASNNPIEGVKMYCSDNPSQYAKRATFQPPSTSGNYTVTPTFNNGTVNGDGSLTYDYLDPITYTNTTDSAGSIPTIKVLTSIQIKEYSAGDSSALLSNSLPAGVTGNSYHGEYGYDIPHFRAGQWSMTGNTNTHAAYSDWDTDNFGGFYRVDRRSNDNTDADEFTFYFCSYNQSISSSTQALRGLGELLINWTLFDDQLISEPNKTTVDDYIAITDSERFYDRAKSYLTDNYAGEENTLVTRAGLTIDAGDNNIVLDPNVGTAAEAFDLTAATFSTFSGVFITAASGNPASQPVVITSNTAGNVTIELVGNDTDTVAALAAAQGATATGDGASEVLASGDSNKITVTGGSNPIITIKCTSFTGNLTTTETITVNSGVTVLGTVTDVNNPAGLSSRTFSLSNIILGTTIQIYNETQVTKRGVAEGYTPTNVFETLVASGTTTGSTLIGDGSSTIAQLITAAGNGLEADPMADTSYVLPSGWTLTTTEVVDSDNRVTISGIYDEGTVPNGDFNVGDSVRIRATCAAATGAFLPFVNTTIANEGGFSMRVDQQADTIYNDNGINGGDANYDNTTLTIAPDYTNFEIDVTDSDDPGVVTVQQIYAKYAYLITTTEGIENFFGAITAENPTNFKINVDVVDLKIQNIGTSDMIITGARLYRSDFTTIVKKGPNGGTLSHDTGELVQFIRPQVESAIDLKDVATTTDTAAIKTDTEAVKKKTNLIPGLL